jgi:hypothetical protein
LSNFCGSIKAPEAADKARVFLTDSQSWEMADTEAAEREVAAQPYTEARVLKPQKSSRLSANAALTL